MDKSSTEAQKPEVGDDLCQVINPTNGFASDGYGTVTPDIDSFGVVFAKSQLSDYAH